MSLTWGTLYGKPTFIVRKSVFWVLSLDFSVYAPYGSKENFYHRKSQKNEIFRILGLIFYRPEAKKTDSEDIVPNPGLISASYIPGRQDSRPSISACRVELRPWSSSSLHLYCGNQISQPARKHPRPDVPYFSPSIQIP